MFVLKLAIHQVKLFVVLKLFLMGSVDEEYECPWCSRKGAGGYAPDPVGYPICTEPRYSCMMHCIEKGVWSKDQYDEAALRRRFATRQPFQQLPDNIWRLICELLSADVVIAIM
jgi:hypothetical protein